MNLTVSTLVLAVFLQSIYLLIKAEDCHFPFTYNNKEYTECTRDDYHRKWCSLDEQYNGRWKKCDEECHFPFTYNGVEHDGCIHSNNHPKPWCSLDAVYEGNWKDCEEGEEIDDNNEGESNKDCVFPFTYKGKTYQQCTKTNWHSYWCSKDSVYNGIWKPCEDAPGCYFPFIYKGRKYDKCTMVNSQKPWCSTQQEYLGEYIYCEDTCKNPFFHENQMQEGCMRRNRDDNDLNMYCKESPDMNAEDWKVCENYHFEKEDPECVFPFTYKGKEYNQCTFVNSGTPWCSTTATYDGKYRFCTGGTIVGGD